MKTQEQEEQARAAVERFVQQTARAHGRLSDELGGEDLPKIHGRKIGMDSSGDESGSSWLEREAENREKGLTILLIRHCPTVAGATGSNCDLVVEPPLTLRGTHEVLAEAVKLYPVSDPQSRLYLRQTILDLVMGPDYIGQEIGLGGSFVGFVIYIWGQSPIEIRMPTKN